MLSFETSGGNEARFPSFLSRYVMKALRYTKRLISFDSTSSKSNRMISKYLEQKLVKHGFVIERLEYDDSKGVRKVNLVAKRGAGKGGLAYFGHSDVVPANKWFTKKFGAFEPKIFNQKLYGRGACDMKGSIGCMLAAIQQFEDNDLANPIYFICTADEEVGFHGARQVVAESKYYREMVEGATKAIIGEPTMLEVVHAHKGSLELKAKTTGVAAHSSTRDGVNSTLPMIPFLSEAKKIHDELTGTESLQSDLFDPPEVGWNITVGDDSPAMNITPAKTLCKIYARPVPNISMEPYIQRMKEVAEANEVKFKVHRWCDPMYCDPESELVRETLRIADRSSPKTVSFATDGGVFSELENKVVFGPGSIEQAHRRDEWISLDQLTKGTEAYANLIRRWCCTFQNAPLKS